MAVKLVKGSRNSATRIHTVFARLWIKELALLSILTLGRQATRVTAIIWMFFYEAKRTPVPIFMLSHACVISPITILTFIYNARKSYI